MNRVWLIFLCPSVLMAQTPALRNGPAATGCFNGVPTTTYAADLDRNILPQLEVHEAIHRQQLATGPCDAILAAILADPFRTAEAEAEAGCGQLLASTAPESLTFELGTLTAWMRARFPALPEVILIRLVMRYCGL